MELGRSVTFFPKAAEWREAVDRMLDRAQRRGIPLPGPAGRLQLGGEVVQVDENRCPDCDNTGFEHSASFAVKGLPHVHRCTNAFCAQRRQRALEKSRRYSTKPERDLKSGWIEPPVKRGRKIR